MQIGVVWSLLLCSPQACLAQEPHLVCVGSLHCTPFPQCAVEKRSACRKFLLQQFPASSERAESMLTEFPGAICGEKGKLKMLRHEDEGLGAERRTLNSVGRI